MITIPPTDGLILVVTNAYEVATASSAGYQLVAIVEAEHLESKFIQKQRHDQNGYSTSSYSEEVLEKVQTPQYVMRLDANSAVAGIAAERDGIAKNAAATAKELSVLQKSFDEQKKALEEMTKNRDSWHKDHDSVYKKWQEVGVLSRKLEGDIAKIGKAVGDLRMREILEGK